MNLLMNLLQKVSGIWLHLFAAVLSTIFVAFVVLGVVWATKGTNTTSPKTFTSKLYLDSVSCDVEEGKVINCRMHKGATLEDVVQELYNKDLEHLEHLEGR